MQTTNIKPTLISTARPAPGPSPGARPLTSVGTVAVTKPGAGASITMIQGGKVVVPGPGTPATRPILAQPGGGALVRGVAPALTLRAPAQPAAAAVAGLSGSIRLASPGSVHLLQPATTRPAATPTAVPRPGAVLGVAGPRATMAAVSFRPSTALVTTARPTLSPTGAATAVTLVQTPGSVTKTIVTQNPAGVFKPITTQVSVSGAPVALKPSPVSGAVPVRVQSAGQRTVTVVSQPLAVSLTSPAPGTGATHIQVPMVPGAVGPPKTRVAVPAGGAMKLVSGVSLAPVQITHTQSAGAGARTIQLPVSGPATKPGASVPVARVTPQQHGPGQVASLVTFVPASGSAASQAGPVNLSTVARPGAVVAPAMTLPNFSQTTLMYDRAEQQQSSVTITTLPPPAPGDAAAPAQPAPAPATITPARITPILPPSQPQDAADKPVPGSPRPSILRKRPDTEPAVTPVKGTALLTSPTSPPRPESSGSSTISATSSLPGLSGDEAQAQPPPAPASIEPSPRKKPRKQQLPPREAATNVSPEWATVKRELGVRDRLEWNTRPEADWEGKVRTWQETWPGTAAQEHDDLQDMVQDQADDEDEMSTDDERDKQLGSFIRGKPQVSLLNSYRHTWKSRHNHFLRYSDVKSKVGILHYYVHFCTITLKCINILNPVPLRMREGRQ